MTLERALKMNPYDETKGNRSAYARYLRYNVDGFYTLSNHDVQRLWDEFCKTYMAEREVKE